MSNFKERICQAKARVIAKTFPQLSSLEIMIDVEDSDDELLGYGKLTSGGYYIEVDVQGFYSKKFQVLHQKW